MLAHLAHHNLIQEYFSMYIRKKKKQAITLLEIMIVILLIGIIGGVVGYNVKSSLDKGKAFKTEYAINQIQEILLLEYSQGIFSGKDIAQHHQKHLKNSGFCKDLNALLKDGWGGLYTVDFDDDAFIAHSAKLDDYKKRQDRTASTSKKKTTKVSAPIKSTESINKTNSVEEPEEQEETEEPSASD